MYAALLRAEHGEKNLFLISRSIFVMDNFLTKNSFSMGGGGSPLKLPHDAVPQGNRLLQVQTRRSSRVLLLCSGPRALSSRAVRARRPLLASIVTRGNMLCWSIRIRPLVDLIQRVLC